MGVPSFAMTTSPLTGQTRNMNALYPCAISSSGSCFGTSGKLWMPQTGGFESFFLEQCIAIRRPRLDMSSTVDLNVGTPLFHFSENREVCATIDAQMREIEIAQCQFLVTNLEARLQVSEIERVALNFEIGSPQITLERKAEAIARRDVVLIEWGEIMTRLEELRQISTLP
jgi:hypothetical protein